MGRVKVERGSWIGRCVCRGCVVEVKEEGSEV